MWEVLLSYKTIRIALPLLGVAAAWIMVAVNPRIGSIPLTLALVWLLCAIVHRWKNKTKDVVEERPQPTVAVGGLVGKAVNTKIEHSDSSVKIRIQGKPEDVSAGGLIGEAERTEVVDSTADAEIQHKQDKEQ
jgi:hypothetical protein